MNQTKSEVPETETEKFVRTSQPLIDYLKTRHPHTTVIVNSNGAELLEGIISITSLTEEA